MGIIKRAAAFLTAAICFLGMLGGIFMYSTVYATGSNDIEQLNSLYDELEAKQKAIQADIDRTKNEKDKQLKQKAQIDSQISLTKQQISVLNNRITLLTNNIAELGKSIAEHQTLIDENYELFKDRIRALYMDQNISTLGLLLGAESFSELLTRAEATSRIAQHDEELLTKLANAKREIEDEKTEIESDKKELESSKSTMNAKQTQLNTQLKQVESQIQDISALEASYLKNIAQVKKDMTAVQSEIDEIYKGINSEGDYTGGKMGWPLPGYSYISSNYGWRFNNTDFHTGIDITGSSVYGKPIAAASSGKVVYVQTSYTAGKGYGIHLIIDHGGGVSTLYGHCSSIKVKVGDYVTRGQTIAYIGSTGWSTGPHLHFEVRENGKYVNPWNYLK